MNNSKILAPVFLKILHAFVTYYEQKNELDLFVHLSLENEPSNFIKNRVLELQSVNKELYKIYNLKKENYLKEHPESFEEMCFHLDEHIKYHYTRIKNPRHSEGLVNFYFPRLNLFIRRQFASVKTHHSSLHCYELANLINDKYDIKPTGLESFVLELKKLDKKDKDAMTLSLSEVKDAIKILNFVIDNVKDEDFSFNPDYTEKLKKEINTYSSLAKYYNEMFKLSL